MIGPIAREGEAPAVPAAVALVVGILLGSRSTSGTLAGILLLALAAAWLFLRRDAADRDFPCAIARVLLWLAAGFLSGRLRVAIPAEASRVAFASVPAASARALQVEGVLTDFWSGTPPQMRGRLDARRILVEGRALEFPAEVFLFVGGEKPVGAGSGRGDRVLLTGHLRPEDLPASERDIALPWTRYRLSVKSGLLVERRGGTPLSWLQAPNRRLFDAMPSRGAAFERDVRGPLAALLLGRTSELDRGMVARYRRGGLYHLLVVSGLHVALAAGVVFWCLRAAGVRGRLRDAALLAAVLLIVLVGGANPPAVRAGLVFAVFLVARLIERPIRGAQAAGLSALVLFLAAPAQVFSIGCVLTFAAVAGIGLFSGPIRARLPERPEWLFGGLATAFAAEVATAPVLLWRFNLLATGAWLTAPLSIPLSGVLIALGGLLLAVLRRGDLPRAARPAVRGRLAPSRVARRARRRCGAAPPDAAPAGGRRRRSAAPRRGPGARRGCGPGAPASPPRSFWSSRCAPAPRAPPAASRSRLWTSVRATRCSCAGSATRCSSTAAAPSTSTRGTSAGPGCCRSCSIAA